MLKLSAVAFDLTAVWIIHTVSHNIYLLQMWLFHTLQPWRVLEREHTLGDLVDRLSPLIHASRFMITGLASLRLRTLKHTHTYFAPLAHQPGSTVHLSSTLHLSLYLPSYKGCHAHCYTCDSVQNSTAASQYPSQTPSTSHASPTLYLSDSGTESPWGGRRVTIMLHLDTLGWHFSHSMASTMSLEET